jgi:hypothetical protein
LNLRYFLSCVFIYLYIFSQNKQIRKTNSEIKKSKSINCPST